MFQTTKEVRRYLPAFEHKLLDLSSLPDEALQGEVMVRVVQLVLKHSFAKDLGARLPAILGLASEVFQQASGLAMLVTILRYVAQAGPGVSDEELRQAIETALPVEGGILKKTLAERIAQVEEVPRLVQWVNLALSADSLEAFIARMDDPLAQV
jgi:hypothetical protein